MTGYLTLNLGAFVSDLRSSSLPEAARQTARRGMTDCVAVMIAGRDTDAPRILRNVLAPGPGESTVAFTSERITAPEAAWINGTAAHALDFDDTGVRGHPSTVLVPAILAEAEHLDLDGERMLTAYVAGYESWAELALREQDSIHSKGWHPTGIWGAVGAAAACASLRGLDAERTAAALALAASHSAGLVANFGTMTKPYHAGKAAHAGVVSARLAEAGFTASLDALEHPQGLLRAVSQYGNTDCNEMPAAGRKWWIVEEGLNIKQYPLCYCTHRCIDGMLALIRQHGLTYESIESIGVAISDRYRAILRNTRPQTGLEAKFSVEFAMASAVIAGRVGLEELSDAFVIRPEVQSLMRRVDVQVGKEYDPGNPNAAPFDRVWVQLRNGQRIDGEPVSHARGHAHTPLTDDELYGKFETCFREAGLADRAADMFRRMSAIESLSARELMRALT